MSTQVPYACTECGFVREMVRTGYRKPAMCTCCGTFLRPKVTTFEAVEINRHDPRRTSNE